MYAPVSRLYGNELSVIFHRNHRDLYADFCVRTEAERKRMLEEKFELQEYQRKQQQIKEKEIEVRLNRLV